MTQPSKFIRQLKSKGIDLNDPPSMRYKSTRTRKERRKTNKELYKIPQYKQQWSSPDFKKQLATLEATKHLYSNSSYAEKKAHLERIISSME